MPQVRDSLTPEAVAKLRSMELRARAIQDAGGAIPEAFAGYHNKPGCTPFEDRSDRAKFWGSQLKA